MHKTCTSLLSRQLLRPEGVRGLCIAVFGQDHESVENASFEKLDHVSRVLSSVPAGMEPEVCSEQSMSFQHIQPSCTLEIF